MFFGGQPSCALFGGAFQLVGDPVRGTHQAPSLTTGACEIKNPLLETEAGACPEGMRKLAIPHHRNAESHGDCGRRLLCLAPSLPRGVTSEGLTSRAAARQTYPIRIRHQGHPHRRRGHRAQRLLCRQLLPLHERHQEGVDRHRRGRLLPLARPPDLREHATRRCHAPPVLQGPRLNRALPRFSRAPGGQGARPTAGTRPAETPAGPSPRTARRHRPRSSRPAFSCKKRPPPRRRPRTPRRSARAAWASP